jgi:hypothetical protein
MKNLFLLLFLVLFTSFVYAQKREYNTPASVKKNTDYLSILKFGDKYCLSLRYSSFSSSAYYDYNSTLITQLSDSTLFAKDSIISNYNFEFIQTEISLIFEKYFSDDIKLKIELPFSNYSLNEKYINFYDTISKQRFSDINKADYSLFRLDNILAGGEYGERFGFFKPTAKLYFKIPTGSENGVFLNNRDFLSDGDFEILPGLDLYFYFKKAMIKIGSTYNFRTEDLKDRLITTFEGNIFSVPGTQLGAEFTYVQNIKGFDTANVFNIHKYPYSENYCEAGINFGIDIGADFIGSFSYKIRLFGTNSWNIAMYNIAFKYKF